MQMKEEDKYRETDTSWLSDIEYLGKPLSDALLKVGEIPDIDRSNAPAKDIKSLYTYESFSNEKTYEDMDYADEGYRLMGLFRFWNVIEYYYPYLTLLEENWGDLLPQHISLMLEGEEKESYERAIYSLAAKLKDPHAAVASSDSLFIENEFGKYRAPVWLAYAEGKLVVGKVDEEYQQTCPLKPGDVLKELNGVDIEDVIEHRKQYISVPEDDKLLNALSKYLLMSKEQVMKITVLRGEETVTLDVQGNQKSYHPVYGLLSEKSSHELLEGNIGLINPNKVESNEIYKIMGEFEETNGLIIDMRQYFPLNIQIPEVALEEYLLGSGKQCAESVCPSLVVPGVFRTWKKQYAGRGIGPIYKKPVVLLMDELTQSSSEYKILMYRDGPNVVVMGRDSVGAAGSITLFTLPGGYIVQFTGLGIRTVEGESYQRVGLKPDIYVEPTIAGIREGRDELMEAAIQYIQKNAAGGIK